MMKLLMILLRGWANYYRFVNSKVVFDKIDTYIWRKSLNWMKRIHQRKETIKYYTQLSHIDSTKFMN